MPLQEQVVPIDFGQGVDSKTDPKTVVAGKMLRLENAVFTTPKRITKRNGYNAAGSTIGAIGSLIDPLLVHEYKEELIAADQGLLVSYSPNQDAWVSRGPYVSTDLVRDTIDQEHAVDGYVDCATLGNYAVYGWSTVSRTGFAAPTVVGEVFGSVVDLTSGTVLVGSQSLSAHQARVRCVRLGGTTLGVIYLNSAGTDLVLRTVVFTSPGVVSFSAPIVISTNFSGRGDPVFYPDFGVDVVETALGAAILYGSTTGVTVSTLNTAGAITNTLVIADALAGGPMHISRNSVSNDLWLYWCDPQTVGAPITDNAVVYAVYTSTLTPVLTKTTVATTTSPNPNYFTNIIARTQSATQQNVYYGYYETSGVDATDLTHTALLNTAGTVGAITTFANGVTPYSRPFNLTLNTVADDYAVFVYRGAPVQLPTALPFLQPTFFVVRLTHVPTSGVPLVVARFASGVANLQSTVNKVIGYTPNVSAITATKMLFGVGVETQEYSTDYWSQSGRGPGGLAGAFSYFIDFASDNAYIAVNAGELAILNGGVMQAYDGKDTSEFGFHLFPEFIGTTTAPSMDGNIANGTYSYIAIYQWVDDQGNLHQSAPSEAVSVTFTGGSNSGILTLTTPYLSQKNGVSIAIYRTKAAGGLTYFLVTDPVFLFAAPPTSLSVTFTDNLSDAALDGNPQPYTSPTGSVLENTTPPPSVAMLAHNNRLWFVDGEERNTVWYTKSFAQGIGLSPSGFMTQQIDPKYGSIGALAEMDDKLVMLKDGGGMFVQSGDGVNDVGSGSTLSFPQIVPSDVGVSVLKSVVLTPNGVMFKSQKGIYILSRALNVAYLGMEVEAYNNQLITAATMLAGKSQIRFLCATGLTLVYDYIFNQWSTFTNHTGKSATVWQGSYVYAKTGSSIYKESTSSYTDNGTAYSLRAQTSWLALGTVQGFQRVRRLIMLGDYANGAQAGHCMQISAAYDFSTTFSTPIQYTFGAANTSGTFQYRERLPQQKCDAISLIIEEVVLGASAEYLDFTNISFEAGVKKGVNKLPAAKSVG